MTPNANEYRRTDDERRERAQVWRLMIAFGALVWILILGWVVVPGGKALIEAVNGAALAGPAACAGFAASDMPACAEGL